MNSKLLGAISNYNKEKVSIISYIVLISLLLTSGITIFAIEQNVGLRQIVAVAGALLFFVVSVYGLFRKKKIPNKVLIISFGSIVYLGLCGIRGTGNFWGLFLKIALFALIIVYYGALSKHINEVFSALYNVVILLSIISLALFVLLHLFKLPIPYTVIERGVYTFYRSYFHLFYTYSEYSINLGSISFYRLQSVFWEPGVYAIYLNLALYHYYFIQDKNNRKMWHLFVLYITLLLTLSTTGLILGIIVFGASKVDATKKASNRVLVLVSAAIIGGIFAINIWLTKVNDGGLSYQLRIYDVLRSLEIWKENFIWGCGYNNTAAFLAEGRGGNSNGLLNWCMTMGIIGLTVVIFPFLCNCITNNSQNYISQYLLLILFLLSNMTEPIITTPIMIFLIASEYIKMIRRRERRGIINLCFESSENGGGNIGYLLDKGMK